MADPTAHAPPAFLAPPSAAPEVHRGKDIGTALARAVLNAAWSARHPLEPFAAKPSERAFDRHYYPAEDGWESPLWRLAPQPGASGEPVILAHALGVGSRSFDFADSLVSALHQAGFDVYLLEHRGDQHAVAPQGAGPFDFDDIAAQDIPAALTAVRRISGFSRALWVGHAMGGQLLYAHLARGGREDIAAAVTLCAPVRFDVPRSQARTAAMTAALLPQGWSLPMRAVQRVLSAFADAAMWAPLASDLAGPTGRGLMLHAGEDVSSGLVRQVARWVASGSLCDRGDRLDYVAALRGLRFPLLAVAAEGDPICPPAAAHAALDALDPTDLRWLCLGSAWGHLDPLLGRQAPSVVYPEVVGWLDRWRRCCW